MSDLKQIKNKYSSAIPALDFDLLLAKTINQSREYILTYPERRLSWFERLKFHSLLYQYKKGAPIAYLLGHKEFFGLDFIVNKNVLIPRSSTELLVEAALEHLQTANCAQRTVLIDIGTGTGCIPIAITKTLKQKSAKALTLTGVIATDISKKALQVAKQNAKRHNVDMQFIRGNLLRPFIKNYSLLMDNCSLIITANLPYLTKEWIKSEPGIQKEPRTALLADKKHGLSLYEKLFQQIQFISLIANCSMLILMEIDPRQLETAMALAKKHFPKAIIEIKQDLAKRDRMIMIKQ